MKAEVAPLKVCVARQHSQPCLHVREHQPTPPVRCHIATATAQHRIVNQVSCALMNTFNSPVCSVWIYCI